MGWLLMCGLILGQPAAWLCAGGTSPATDPSTGLTISPTSLDFGLVGVGRSKALSVILQNNGNRTVTGIATVPPPFQLTAQAYSLEKGQSQTMSVQYLPTAPGSNAAAIAFSGGASLAVSLTGRALNPPRPPGNLRVTSKPATVFNEEQEADVIIRYYSDSTSYMIKPALMDGQFRSVYDRAKVLAIARQQPRHELAVVVLVHYPNSYSEEPIKQKWQEDLAALGYQRILYLRGERKMNVKGLQILPGPQSTGETVSQ